MIQNKEEIYIEILEKMSEDRSYPMQEAVAIQVLDLSEKER